MEKYRHFSDKSTGINPFLPPTIPNDAKSFVSSNFIKKMFFTLFSFMISFFLLPLRVAIQCVCLLCFFLFYLLSLMIPNVIIRSRGLRVMFRKFLMYPIIRSYLFFIGFSEISESCANLKKLAESNIFVCEPEKLVKSSPWSSTTDGRLYVCNFTSFIEVLYLTMKLYPTFGIIHSDGTLSAVGPFKALRHALKFKLLNGTGSFNSVSSICEYAKRLGLGPVVIFPEAMKSNGLNLLQWEKAPFLKDLVGLKSLIPCTVFLMCTYSGNSKITASNSGSKGFSYAPTHTVNNAFWYLFFLYIKPLHSMKITWLTDVRFVEPPSEGARVQQSNRLKGEALNYNFCNSQSSSDEDFVGGLNFIHSQLGGNMKVLNVKGSSLEEFAAYWAATQRKKYIKKRV